MRPSPLGRRALFGAAAGFGLFAAPAVATAPRRSLTLLVGAPAGSPADLRARSMAPFLARHWPRIALAVENVAGSGGLEAARYVAEADASRALLGLVATPALLARCIQDSEPALLDRLSWFGPLTEEPLLLVAAADAGGFSLASGQGAPGQRLIGSGPPGSASHLAAWRLAEMLPECRALPFVSPMAARRAAAAGHVAAALLSLAELRRAGAAGVVPIATATAARLAAYPSVPTLTERGLPLLAAVQRGFVGQLAFGGADRLAAALRALRVDPEFIAWADETGATPGTADPTAWGGQLAEERRNLTTLWARSPWVQGG